MSKRITGGLCSLAALAMLLLAACGYSSKASTTQTGGINYNGTITIWHNWQGSYLTEKEKIFNAYTAMHPGVTITLINQLDIVAKTTAAVKAGNGPDIVAWVDDQLGTLASSKTLIPMDQYISKSTLESTYSKAAAAGLEYNGHVWGVPESVEAVTIMYNKALITADQLPKTTDDLLAFNKAYSAAHPGSYGIVWNTTDPYFNADWFYGFGGFYTKEDGSVGLNTPGALKAGQFISALRPTMPAQISYDVANSLFTEGKAAAIINGPWSYADYVDPKKANLQLGFALLPTTGGSAAAPFVGVKSLWVTKTAADPALDADLMMFYTNKANQIEMAGANKEIPANLAADNDPAVTGDPAIGGYAMQVQNGVPLPNTPYMGKLWGPVGDALTAIWQGTQTPDKALADAQTAALQGIASLNG